MTMLATTLLLATLSTGDAASPPAPGVEPLAGQSASSPPLTDADRIRQKVREGDRVRVTDDQGREWRGRIVALGADGLTVVTPDRQRAPIAYGKIVRIDRPHDTLANGALIGFAAGAALGLLGVIAEERAECEPGGFFSCGDPTAAAYILAPAVLGGLGAAAGLGIDALIRKEPNLYRRGAGTHMVLAPALGRGMRGVVVTLRW